MGVEEEKEEEQGAYIEEGEGSHYIRVYRQRYHLRGSQIVESTFCFLNKYKNKCMSNICPGRIIDKSEEEQKDIKREQNV